MRSPASLLRFAGCTLQSVNEQLQFACSLSHAPDSLRSINLLLLCDFIEFAPNSRVGRCTGFCVDMLIWCERKKEGKVHVYCHVFFLSSILKQVHMRFLCEVVKVRTQREVDQATICSKEYFTTYVDSPTVVYTIMAYRSRLP